nr:PucR family transcriptional regulator [Actinomycetota bacterium]
MAASLSEATIRRIEQSSGALATLSVARMDDQLAWFRRLPADQRSWVTLVAQAGVASFVEWLRSPDQVLRLTGEVFGTAPRELARRLSLQQTVELVRQTIAVVEERVPALVGPAEEQAVADAMLRFSREIAFAAARVYASAAETRGAWDARLEAMVIDGLVRA